MDTKTLPQLSDTELRVLGSLMEKSRTTPDYYPMTLNSLTAACNQKSSRRPVVNYDDDTVMGALDTLKKRGLISTVIGGSSRAVKYKHNFAIVFPVIPQEVAIICLLMLRGPLTPGEINSNSGRLWEYESLDEVQEYLEKLSSEEPPYIQQLPRRPGQKEARFKHLFGGTELADDDIDESSTGSSSKSQLEERLVKVEGELAELKATVARLMAELGVS